MLRSGSAVLLLSMALAACSEPTVRTQGYLVIGPSAARVFGLTAGDTLQEVSMSSLGAHLRTSVDSLAALRGRVPSCTRSFLSRRSQTDRAPIVVVLTETHCPFPDLHVLDGASLGGFDMEGHLLAGAWFHDGGDAITVRCPAYRDSAGAGVPNPDAADGCLRSPQVQLYGP